jgi:hypothetical protein
MGAAKLLQKESFALAGVRQAADIIERVLEHQLSHARAQFCDAIAGVLETLCMKPTPDLCGWHVSRQQFCCPFLRPDALQSAERKIIVAPARKS